MSTKWGKDATREDKFCYVNGPGTDKEVLKFLKKNKKPLSKEMQEFFEVSIGTTTVAPHESKYYALINKAEKVSTLMKVFSKVKNYSLKKLALRSALDIIITNRNKNDIKKMLTSIGDKKLQLYSEAEKATKILREIIRKEQLKLLRDELKRK